MGQISGDEGLSVMAADTHQLAERCTELVTVDPARPGGVQRLSQPVPSTCMTASEKSSKVDQEHTDNLGQGFAVDARAERLINK